MSTTADPTSAPTPPPARSYLDDIDGDDEPTSGSVSATANGSIDSSAVGAASSSPAAPTRSSGLDDIDDDDDPPNTNAQAATSSKGQAPSTSPTTAAGSSADPSSSASALSPAAVEVERILGILAADAALAATFTPPDVTAGLAAPAATNTIAQPDHFSIFSLPQPDVNRVGGDGLWSVDEETLKRAYQRLVRLIHPDKTPVAGAKDAFEAVKAAHVVLSSDSKRFDYVKSYVAFRRAVAMRAPDFMPASVVSASLDDTLEQGRQIAAAKAARTASIASRLHAQGAARRAAVLQGEVERRRQEEARRQEEMKQKVMQSESEGSDSDSDDEAGLSVAEKIRRAKQGKNKRIRVL